MNKPGPDCIGDGNYYQIEMFESVAEPVDSLSTADAAGAEKQIESDVRGDIRFDAETGEAYCIRAIIKDLRNPDWNIRIQAAWDLGTKGDVEGVVPLLEALRDDHRQVRDRAHEALVAMEADEEPLPVRVLLCDTVDDRERTDILLRMAGARTMRGPIFGLGAVKQYCENVVDEHANASLGPDEQAILTRLRRSAAAVLSEVSRRADSVALLRAGERYGGMHSAHLLRSTVEVTRSDEAERLLRAADAQAKNPRGR